MDTISDNTSGMKALTTPTQAQIEAAVQAMRVHCLRIARPLQELNELAKAALTAAAEVGPLKKRPVAWRVRDCADGWIVYEEERKAYDDAEQRGAQMQGLYCRDPATAEVEPSLANVPPEEQREAHKWMDRQLVAATIERCAQVAQWFSNVEKFTAEDVAARIRALKDQS